MKESPPWPASWALGSLKDHLVQFLCALNEEVKYQRASRDCLELLGEASSARSRTHLPDTQHALHSP